MINELLQLDGKLINNSLSVITSLMNGKNYLSITNTDYEIIEQVYLEFTSNIILVNKIRGLLILNSIEDPNDLFILRVLSNGYIDTNFFKRITLEDNIIDFHWYNDTLLFILTPTSIVIYELLKEETTYINLYYPKLKSIIYKNNLFILDQKGFIDVYQIKDLNNESLNKEPFPISIKKINTLVSLQTLINESNIQELKELDCNYLHISLSDRYICKVDNYSYIYTFYFDYDTGTETLVSVKNINNESISFIKSIPFVNIFLIVTTTNSIYIYEPITDEISILEKRDKSILDLDYIPIDNSIYRIFCLLEDTYSFYELEAK
jgi:hypothetical protein